MKITKTRGTIVEVVHEPGNGARYRIIACRYTPGKWSVAVPGWGGCLTVQEGSYLHYGYVMEKIQKVNEVDASEIAKVVAAIVPRCSVTGCTGESGKRI